MKKQIVLGKDTRRKEVSISKKKLDGGDWETFHRSSPFSSALIEKTRVQIGAYLLLRRTTKIFVSKRKPLR